MILLRILLHIKPSPKIKLAPDVLWFQPFSRATGEFNHALVLGLKIELADIDAVSIPIPNPSLSLINRNSEYIYPLDFVLVYWECFLWTASFAAEPELNTISLCN